MLPRQVGFAFWNFKLRHYHAPQIDIAFAALLAGKRKGQNNFFTKRTQFWKMTESEPKLTNWLLIRCRNRESSQPRSAELAVSGRFPGQSERSVRADRAGIRA
jgi:hypothetical protein